MTWRGLTFGVAISVMLPALSATADAPNLRTVGIARKSDKLVASVGLQDLFQPRDVDRLLSGFSTRVLIRVALLREGSDEPVAQAMRLSEIVYDLWDEKIRVRTSTDQPTNPKSTRWLRRRPRWMSPRTLPHFPSSTSAGFSLAPPTI
jgi:hypothetical protein